MLDVAKLNIALTLPGESSLGTFEAGAISALLVGLQRINADHRDAVAVDVVTGASSGALTAVLAAAALLTGSDPVRPLRQAWVSEPSLTSLRGHEMSAPLSLNRARVVAHRLLGEMLLAARDGDERGRRAQTSDLKLEFALTSLRGFNYEIPQRSRAMEPRAKGKAEAVTATSYIDWAGHEFVGGHLNGLTDHWSAAVDSAIASASLPLAFAPTLLDRSHQRTEWVRRGVTNLPASSEHWPARGRPLTLWCSDGGLVDREPLGRCLRLVNERDRANPQGRLVLVIRPYPDDAPESKDEAWTGDAEPPRWRATLARALRVLVTHSLYEDLRRLEQTNDRIAWNERLCSVLAELLKDDAAATSALSAVVERMQKDKARWPGVEREPTKGDVRGLLEQALGSVAGLEGKRAVNVDIVAARNESELAGGAIGFTSEHLRATDFLVGYDAMLRWMAKGLHHRVHPDWAEEGVAAARDRAATIPGWIGEIPLRRRPPLRVSAQLLRVGLRAARAGLANPRARG
jgi:Patatin-like phospholipase